MTTGRAFPHALFATTATLFGAVLNDPACAQAAPGVGAPIALVSVSAGIHDRVDTPMLVSLGALPGVSGPLVLVEVTGSIEHPVLSQVLAGDPPRLAFVLEGLTPPGAVRAFELRRAPEAPSLPAGEGLATPAGMTATDDGAGIRIDAAGREVLTYRYAEQPAPEGVDAIFVRGGFVHPLRTPMGETLTCIQPPDHRHHYGIWNPWTRTSFEGRDVDFWNLGSGQGTVRAHAVVERSSGPVVAGFRALLDHVDFTSGAERIALREQWDVRAWSIPGRGEATRGAATRGTARTGGPVPEAPRGRALNVVDFSSTIAATTDAPLRILAYRYQGFSIRATGAWSDDTSRILTSEGHTKEDGNATRARWILAEGLSGSRPGILLMGAPTNHDAPERLRIWPAGENGGVGNVFINFNPAQDADWEIAPGRPETLRYRMVTYDGGMTAREAERIWTDWAEPPAVTVRPTGLQGRRILVYTRNGPGYVHDNIAASVAALRKLGAENGFEIEVSDDPATFAPENLARFDALVFSNTNNDAFETDAQRAALQAYVRRGGGIVGIHSASGSERGWPWFSALLGGNFVRHAPGQDFVAAVVDEGNPATAGLPLRWELTAEECYFLDELNPRIRVLLSADLSTVEDPDREPFPGALFADGYPLAWVQEFDGGRQFYTSLGHPISRYSEPDFLRHVLGGIRWVVNGDR